jgi:GNAT superfamily N-acetyltransferase
MHRPVSNATLPPRTLHLPDGCQYVLRPLTAGDTANLVEFFRTLSAETIRQRYGYLIHNMSPERAHRLVAVDPKAELALGIFENAGTDQESLCAMGRLVHDPDGESAECAFLVHDRKRRLGMASRLLFFLRLAGRRRGLRRLFAQVRRENRAMLDVFLQNGALLHFDAGSRNFPTTAR